MALESYDNGGSDEEKENEVEAESMDKLMPLNGGSALDWIHLLAQRVRELQLQRLQEQQLRQQLQTKLQMRMRDRERSPSTHYQRQLQRGHTLSVSPTPSLSAQPVLSASGRLDT